MNITVEELMANAFVLTINQERLDAFMKRWDRYGLPRPRPFWGFHMRPSYYSEISSDIGTRGANISLTHYAAVKMAEAMDLPFIFIMEDDALPCNHIKEKLPLVLKNIPDDAWVLRLGMLPLDRRLIDLPETKVVPSTRRSGGAHAYVIFKSYYKKYEDIYYDLIMLADFSLINHDSRVHGDKIRVYNVLPTLFSQKEVLTGYSTVTDSYVYDNIARAQIEYGGDFDFS